MNKSKILKEVELPPSNTDELLSSPFIKGKDKSKVSSWEATKFTGLTLDLEPLMSPNGLLLDNITPASHMSLTNLSNLLGNILYPLRITKKSLASLGYDEEVLYETLLRLQGNYVSYKGFNVTQNPIQSLNSPSISDFRYFNKVIYERCLYQERNHISVMNRNTEWGSSTSPKVTPLFNNMINISSNNLCKEYYRNESMRPQSQVDYGFLSSFHSKCQYLQDEQEGFRVHESIADKDVLFIPDMSIIPSFLSEETKGESKQDIFFERHSGDSQRKRVHDKLSDNKHQCIIKVDETEEEANFNFPPYLFLSEMQKIWDEMVLSTWLKTNEELEAFDSTYIYDSNPSADKVEKSHTGIINSIAGVFNAEGFYYEAFRTRVLKHYDTLELMDIGNGSKIPINNGTSLEGISANYMETTNLSFNKQYSGDHLILSFSEDYQYDKELLVLKLNSWRQKIRPLISNLLDTSTSINRFMEALLSNEYYFTMLKSESFGISDIIRDIQQPHTIFQQTVVDSNLKIIDNASKSGVGIGDFVKQLM